MAAQPEPKRRRRSGTVAAASGSGSSSSADDSSRENSDEDVQDAEHGHHRHRAEPRRPLPAGLPGRAAWLLDELLDEATSLDDAQVVHALAWFRRRAAADPALALATAQQAEPRAQVWCRVQGGDCSRRAQDQGQRTYPTSPRAGRAGGGAGRG